MSLMQQEVETGHLADLVASGMSIREIAAAAGLSVGAVRHRLRRAGLETRRAGDPKGEAGGLRPEGVCPKRGPGPVAPRRDGGTRCLRCRSNAVSERRHRIKQELLAEAGGACVLCGYSRCVAALHFHHLEPNAKSFSLGYRGVTRSLAAARVEADKCVLLCANCHAEVESGASTLPSPVVHGESRRMLEVVRSPQGD